MEILNYNKINALQLAKAPVSAYPVYNATRCCKQDTPLYMLFDRLITEGAVLIFLLFRLEP